MVFRLEETNYRQNSNLHKEMKSTTHGKCEIIYNSFGLFINF